MDIDRFKNELGLLNKYKEEKAKADRIIESMLADLKNIKSASPLLIIDRGKTVTLDDKSDVDGNIKKREYLERKLRELKKETELYEKFIKRVDHYLSKLLDFDRELFMSVYGGENVHSWEYWFEKSEEKGTLEGFFQRKMTIIKNL